MSKKEAQANKRRRAELQAKESWVSSSANTSGITSVGQALEWARRPENISLVGMDNVVAQLQSDLDFVNMGYRGNFPLYVKEGIYKIANVKIDPVSFVKAQLPDAIFRARYGNQTALNQIAPSLNVLINNKVPVTEIQGLIDAGVGKTPAPPPKPSFMDKVFGIAENLIVGGLTGGLGLSALQVAGLNTALAIASGAKVEDALKAGLAGLGANQVGQYLQTVSAVTADPIVNSAITNAAQSAAAATVLGQDVKTAALAGLAGGTVAGALYKASDKAAISRAAGEYTQAIAAGQSPQMAMMNALSAFADTEMDEARRQIQADPEVKKATRLAEMPVIDQAAPYRPQYGMATAALEGSEIGGRPVTDVPTDKGDESFPKLFEKGEMRSPIGASVSDLYEVKNNLGEIFQARDITYQNGEVQRIIFDPATGSYKQQMLKDIPSTGTASLPGITVTGAEDDGVNKAAELLAFIKPQTKEFSQSLLKLQTQDLRDLAGLLSAGTSKDSPFSGEVISGLQKNFDTAEARANELLAKATADPTAENLSAATQAQNDALTAKFQLSQALLLPETDISKADLSVYNKYPEATQKFIEDGQVVYAKGTGAPGSPVEILGSEPYVAPELKFLPSGARAPTTGQDEGISDLEALKQLSLVRGQPLGQNLRYQMNQAKVAANEALVALQSANTPETVQAARDALANYELSQKMYTQVAGEEFPLLPDEKLATQEFPLVDEAVKTGQMMALSTAMPMTPAQRYAQYKRLSGQGDDEKDAMGDTGLGIAVLPRFEGMMEPQMFARGGLAALRRI